MPIKQVFFTWQTGFLRGSGHGQPLEQELEGVEYLAAVAGDFSAWLQRQGLTPRRGARKRPAAAEASRGREMAGAATWRVVPAVD